MIKKILIVMGILLIVVGIIGINQPKEYVEGTITPKVTIIYPEKQDPPTRTQTEKPEESTEDIQPIVETENTSESTKLNPAKKKTDKEDFTLSVGSNSVKISEGVDEATLEKGPGWMESSAAPGKNGVCVIYGHRNRKHLLLLKDVKVGDSLTITYEGKDYVYKIEEIQIYDKNDTITIPSTDEPMLMIMTCYPFRYEGRAPRQILIKAKKANS